MIGFVLIAIGIILVLDQLYLFVPVPFGGFLGDLSALDLTGSPILHHWMVGVVMIVFGVVIVAKTANPKMFHRRK